MTLNPDKFVELNRGVVFPKHCDHLGHMNVRHYASFFDDAGFHLWNRIGVPMSTMRETKICPVVAKIEINYIHELIAGDLLVIEGVFTRIGTKSLGHHMRMLNAETGTLCATQDTVEVFFNLETRQSAPMPNNFRETLERNVVVSPE